MQLMRIKMNRSLHSCIESIVAAYVYAMEYDFVC